MLSFAWKRRCITLPYSTHNSTSRLSLSLLSPTRALFLFLSSKSKLLFSSLSPSLISSSLLFSLSLSTSASLPHPRSLSRPNSSQTSRVISHKMAATSAINKNKILSGRPKREKKEFFVLIFPIFTRNCIKRNTAFLRFFTHFFQHFCPFERRVNEINGWPISSSLLLPPCMDLPSAPFFPSAASQRPSYNSAILD